MEIWGDIFRENNGMERYNDNIIIIYLFKGSMMTIGKRTK